MNRKVNDNSSGQINDPIIDFIKTENIIVDSLHMYLRIADKLIGLLHKCLETLDGTYGCTLDQNPNFKSYIEFLTQICIRNPYWLEQKRFKLRILNGDEKRRLFNFTTEVTPYIHAFSSHVHQQIKHLKSKDLSLNDFSMQSLEKFNDFSTQYFQRSTNKRDDIEVQIAKK